MKIRHFLIILIFPVALPISAQEIALQLYSLRNEMKEDPIKYHELIAEWGVAALEGGGTYGFSDGEYGKILEDNGLRVIGIGADYNQLTRDIRPIVTEAKKYGAKYVTCYWIPHMDGPISLDEAKVATALFNSVGEEFKKEDITFLYHPHGYEFASDGKRVVMDYILENATHFAFNLDVYWIKMGGGDPLKIMKKHRGKFPLLHLKDRLTGTPGSKNGQGDIETNVVLGTGDIDIAGIIKEAKKQGTAYLVIEDESSRSVNQIPQSISFIRKELNK